MSFSEHFIAQFSQYSPISWILKHYLFFVIWFSSEIIYSEPNSLYRNTRPEPQSLGLDFRRRTGDEANKAHHHHNMAGVSSANGQMRHVTSHAPRGSLLAYDPHLMHLSPIDRRESSASAGSSIGSYDSGSTLTSDLDNSAIMTRLRKSFEQKEEFLRRGLPQSTDRAATALQSNQQTTSPEPGDQWSGGNIARDKCKHCFLFLLQYILSFLFRLTLLYFYILQQMSFNVSSTPGPIDCKSPFGHR